MATKETAEQQTSDAQAQTDAATEAENARIAANQERYEARVSGKSSAEVNHDEAVAAGGGEHEFEEGMEQGGQTVVAEPQAKKKAESSSTTKTATPSSSGSSAGS